MTCRGKVVGLRLDILAFGMMSKQLGIKSGTKDREFGYLPTSSRGFNGHDKKDTFRRRRFFKPLTGSKVGGI